MDKPKYNIGDEVYWLSNDSGVICEPVAGVRRRWNTYGSRYEYLLAGGMFWDREYRERLRRAGKEDWIEETKLYDTIEDLRDAIVKECNQKLSKSATD